MPSSAIALRADKLLTPAMVAVVWEIASALDERRISAEVMNAVWLEIPTSVLRGDEARQDNVWLRECLTRLTGVKLFGEFRGNPWGAVVLAQWEIVDGGSIARLLIPPMGVYALRSPANFAKIEEQAAHRMAGHAKRLYALLADKKRLSRSYWVYSLDEIKSLMGVEEQKSYARWSDFRTRVLDPAIAAINEHGSVHVAMTPQSPGRSIRSVRFDWRWKNLDELREAEAKANDEDPPPKPPEKPAIPPESAPQQQPAKPEPPPVDPAKEAMAWWSALPEGERSAWSDKVGRVLAPGLPGRAPILRRESDIARQAWGQRLELEADRQEAEIAPQASALPKNRRPKPPD